VLAGHRIDVARARSEIYPRPGALPEVGPATLERDLWRRDFTVNAMAVRLNGHEAGELVAVPRALEDLQSRELRVLHQASFGEDPTRLLRLARYLARLGFKPQQQTLALAAEAVQGGALASVSGSRIGNELRLLAREPDPVLAFAALRELGIDRALHPGFGLTDDAWAARALELLGNDGRRDLLVLALVVRRLPSREALELLDVFAFPGEDRDAIVRAGHDAPSLCIAIEAAGRPSELARALSRAGPEAVALAGALGPAHDSRRWLSDLRRAEIAIDGGDLLAAGIPAGPAIGRGLAAAHAAMLDGEALTPAEQLAVALRAAGDEGGH
jgi:tRNA nucleotidyltransferase (CCA-adding enzyme)